MGNVAYNAVRLLEEFIQVLFAKDIRLNLRRVARSQTLVEDGCQIHTDVLQLAGAGVGLGSVTTIRGMSHDITRLGVP